MLSLYPVARGQRSMAAAVDDGSIRLFGEPDLVEALPTWFAPVGGDARWAHRGHRGRRLSRATRQRVSVTLRDPARHLRVEPAGEREVAGEQLAGHDRHDRHQPVGDARRQADRRPRRARPPRGRSDMTIRLDPELAEPHEQRVDVGRGRARRREHEDRVAGFGEGERAVEEVGGGVRIGGDPGQLLELQRQLPGRGVLVAAPDDDEPVARARRDGARRPPPRAPSRAPRPGRPARRRAPRLGAAVGGVPRRAPSTSRAIASSSAV